MKRILIVSLFFATVIWGLFAAILLGYQPRWLPEKFLQLTRPGSLADFGQAFSSLDGLISSMALMLGLFAVLIQVKQSADANIINALTARLQFLLAEYDRLDNQISTHINKHSGKASYDKNLIDNMVKKRKERLEESKKVDENIQKLLPKI